MKPPLTKQWLAFGEITQIPPMYSAVKVTGKKYEYARWRRRERPQRQVTITEFVRTSPIELENGTARFTFRVACSKGIMSVPYLLIWVLNPATRSARRTASQLV